MILYVEPDADARARTREVLADAGFDIREAASLGEARTVLSEVESLQGVVTEYELPDGTGLELLEACREAAPDAVCVLFTDTPVEELDTTAFGAVGGEYLRKGEGAREELVSLLEHGLAFQTQTAYPLPENETARVAALERYAEEPEALAASLNRLTEIATALFDLDAAAVGLVDAHEERFLSCHGISLDPLEREETVCTYAILDEDVTVIEDTEADPRFSDNEGLADAGIRFYAGAPVVTPTGEAIGTFCVYDDEPRTFGQRERELLGLFAEEVMDQLELRRRLRAGGADE